MGVALCLRKMIVGRALALRLGIACLLLVAAMAAPRLMPANCGERCPPRFEEERAWPQRPGFWLKARATLPLGSESGEPGDDRGRYELALAVAGSGPLEAWAWRGMLNAQAASLRGIEFDTAPYALSPTVQGFGVRAYYATASQEEAAEALSLFGVRGGKLVRLMPELGLQLNRRNLVADSECGGSSSWLRRSLLPAQSRHAGLADMEVIETEIWSTAVREGDDCIVRPESQTQRRYMLLFNGQEYVLPPALSAAGADR